MQCGVDANSTDRVLLQSSKPSLHTNVDCNALVAAVVSRQISVVRLLLEVIKVMLINIFWFCSKFHIINQAACFSC